MRAYLERIQVELYNILKIFFPKRIKVGVIGIIENKSKILLTKRNNLLPEGGKWCLPGGHMKFGEKAEESLERELNEEIKINTIKKEFLFYHDEIIPRLKLDNIVLAFLVKTNDTPRGNWEVSEIKWFNRDEIDSLDIAFTHKEILKRYFKNKSK